MSVENRDLEKELNRLFEAYRSACDAPEASADFMPGLWAQIESAGSWTERLWKWANGLAVAAAAASVLLVALQLTSRPQEDFYSGTYVETLMAQTEAEMAPAELAGLAAEAPGEQPQR